MTDLIRLNIQASREALEALLKKLKEYHNSEFQYQPALTKQYADSIDAPETEIACFRAEGEGMFNSIVYLGINSDGLTVRNITSQEEPILGYENYNRIMEAFFKTVITPNLTGSENVKLTSRNKDIEDLLDEDTLRLLQEWERACNKSNPTTHPADYDRWLKFVASAYRHNSALTASELRQWLEEERDWSEAYEKQLSDIERDYEYSIDLLNKTDI